MIGLSVDADISAGTDLLGKHITDLQDGVTIDSDSITGTLKHVAEYTDFSSIPSEQSGNYLALHCTTDVDDAVVTATVNRTATLDKDGILIARIANKDTQTVTITASKDGYETATKVYTLTGLTCNEA